MKTILGFHPSGMLRMSNFVPDKIVESTHSHQHYQALTLHLINTNYGSVELM